MFLFLGDIFSSPVAGSLHTLPFQVLRQLFDSTPLTTDDGVLLRRTTIDIGAIHLLLGCLSVFTHQSQDINLPGVQHEVGINQQYWKMNYMLKSLSHALLFMWTDILRYCEPGRLV